MHLGFFIIEIALIFSMAEMFTTTQKIFSLMINYPITFYFTQTYKN